ncbi:hypothetical protein [Brachyspira aalborgi]|uniref:hypothetical protein n=1 Tax=Brachyspira aalborgi TaxID=29522 RepID=UPI00266D2B87|nr:hypothetical protein [Brachyspira aalborgi]
MKPELEMHAEIYSKKLVCGEKKNGVKFILYANGFEFYKIKIDGDVEKNTTTKKCDFLVIKKDTENIEIFIELKGSDIKKAYEQIITSYKKYSDKSKNPKLYAAIVSSKCPSRDTSIQNKQKELAKIFKSFLFVKNNDLEVKYNFENNTIEKVN